MYELFVLVFRGIMQALNVDLKLSNLIVFLTNVKICEFVISKKLDFTLYM